MVDSRGQRCGVQSYSFGFNYFQCETDKRTFEQFILADAADAYAIEVKEKEEKKEKERQEREEKKARDKKAREEKAKAEK